jgi:uncharacterized damage-inducible protein DinB
MVDLEELRDLFRQMEWADATVWRVVLDGSSLGEDRDLHRLLYHLHVVQHAFLSFWQAEALEFPEESALASPVELGRWARQYYTLLRPVLEKVTALDLPREIHVPWAQQVVEGEGGEPVAATLAETMRQVVLHSTYHRGQVNSCLRRLGAEPPLVDYIVWIWRGKPPADWAAIGG